MFSKIVHLNFKLLLPFYMSKLSVPLSVSHVGCHSGIVYSSLGECNVRYAETVNPRL